VNSSSIMLVFAIAGFISVGIHELVIGPIAFGPNNLMHQSAKKYQQAVKSKPVKVIKLNVNT
jgi:hypothetical protein